MQKLSDAQLMTLSQLVNDRPKHRHGVTLKSLVERGLAEPIANPKYPKTHCATRKGIKALNEARAAGW